MTEQMINLDLIEFKDDCSPRGGLAFLDEDRIAEFEKLYRAKGFQGLPPPELVPLGDGRYRPADAWHRLTALRKAGIKEARCIIVTVPSGHDCPPGRTSADDYAFLRSLEKFRESGLPLTDAQKREVGLRLLREHPDYSDYKIADLAGCTRQAVSKWRKGEVPGARSSELPTKSKVARRLAGCAADMAEYDLAELADLAYDHLPDEGWEEAIERLQVFAAELVEVDGRRKVSAAAEDDESVADEDGAEVSQASGGGLVEQLAAVVMRAKAPPTGQSEAKAA